MLHLLHRVGQVADELCARRLDGSALTPRQYVVLTVVASRQAVSQSDIVTATGIDRSTLADIVRRLVDRGLVARRRSKVDARAYDVRLTANGQSVLRAAQPEVDRVEDLMLRTLPPSKRADFTDALSTLVRAFTQGHAPAIEDRPKRKPGE